MNHEDAFNEEAHEEAIEPRSAPKSQARARTSEDVSDSDTESSPLIGSAHAQRQTHKRGYSYQKAINEPWTGAHGAGPLPWYKTPSVCSFASL